MSNQNQIKAHNHAKKSHYTGRLGEAAAISFLEKKGYKLLRQNYRIQGAEIDLIMEKGNLMLFVEVKTRRGSDFGEPEEALTRLKKQKILLAINHFFIHNNKRKKWRCDLVAIVIKNKIAFIKHYFDIYSE
jgi:putative endonuclease